MLLSKFKIHNFRSVQNTDWIEANQLTCFVGKNEAGKTNFLLPLWKFNPAVTDDLSRLNPQKDYPKSRFSLFNSDKSLSDEAFISTLFSLNVDDCDKINEIITSFNSSASDNVSQKKIDIEFKEGDYLLVEKNWKNNVYFYKSNLVGEKLFQDLAMEGYIKEDLLLNLIPKFIYFSEYGNLDSTIHLKTVAHQIQNPSQVITDKDRQKVRTTKTLFDFVGLNIASIDNLGNENSGVLNEKEVENKTKRQDLINSASSWLTEKFNEWWKDENYTFRMVADGTYFWIYVSDQLRRDQIELEYRSRGLQWFFSFYLIFLVESGRDHKDFIFK